MKKAMLWAAGLLLWAGSALALAIGQGAPDFSAEDWQGKPVRIADYAGKQNVLLVFSRYIACSWCQMFIIDLEQHQAEIAATNTEVVIVSLSPKETLTQYPAPKDFKFRLVPDPGRKLFELYGVKIDNPKMTGNVFWQSLRFLGYLGKYEYVPKGLEGPHAQPPAVFIIGRDGKIKSAQVGKDVADNPKAADLVSALKKLNP